MPHARGVEHEPWNAGTTVAQVIEIYAPPRNEQRFAAARRHAVSVGAERAARQDYDAANRQMLSTVTSHLKSEIANHETLWFGVCSHGTTSSFIAADRCVDPRRSGGRQRPTGEGRKAEGTVGGEYSWSITGPESHGPKHIKRGQVFAILRMILADRTVAIRERRIL